MSFTSEGIGSVRVFELPAGIWLDGTYFASPRTALVRWRSSLSNMFYQVYVNGRYTGATIDSDQREMLVHIPASVESAVRIEVFAVKPEQAHINFSDEISPLPIDSGRVKLKLLRSQTLPIGATLNIYCDGGTGQIDYDEPINDSPLPVWPSWLNKAGFGMSRFAMGDFGWDSPAAVGFAKGSFGNGEFGLDADMIEWVSQPMPMGAYRFGVTVTDERGNESDASEIGPVTVAPAARPAEKLSIISFDKQTGELILYMETLEGLQPPK
jgi:hypothetical protein